MCVCAVMFASIMKSKVFNWVDISWCFQIIRIDMKLANEDVSMLTFTSEQITAPFLLPEMVVLPYLCCYPSEVELLILSWLLMSF